MAEGWEGGVLQEGGDQPIELKENVLQALL